MHQAQLCIDLYVNLWHVHGAEVCEIKQNSTLITSGAIVGTPRHVNALSEPCEQSFHTKLLTKLQSCIKTLCQILMLQLC